MKSQFNTAINVEIDWVIISQSSDNPWVERPSLWKTEHVSEWRGTKLEQVTGASRDFENLDIIFENLDIIFENGI